jgi:O-antigen ligase
MGRFLALVAVALAGVVAWTEERRRAGLATAAFLVLAAALTITFSVSSMLALFAGLCAVVAVRWGIGAGALTGAGVAAALAGVVVAIGGGGQISEETTGRSGLVSGGLELAADRPFWGYGSGTFSAEFTDRFEPEEGIAVESHTEPITVAVEQGIIGLIPFTLLVAVALISIAAAAGLSMGGARDPVLATLLAMLVVMVVHSLGYAALMIDPVTWALLAVGTTLGAARPMRQDRGGTASAAEPSRSGAYVATSGSG